ncbi:ABC transporter ATP-binding protein [Candidatus Wolfebacteria bacterium]|nr:ABC transporter ATP-binding protein [Candidatus Wolfebacteria bacterium]
MNVADLWKKISFVWQGLDFYQKTIVTLTQLIVFIVSILLIHRGVMTLGQLVMFNGYAAMLFGPFVSLGRNWRYVQAGVVSVQEAEKILSFPKENYSPQNAVILSDIKGEIIFENVVFSYQGKRGNKKQVNVLDGLSFRVNPGEIVALVGESGVGKSTLVDLISGYYFPTSGKVLIDGRDVKKLDLNFLRSRIGVMPQEVVLFNDTIKKNIAYGKFSASERKIKEAAKKSDAEEFIESFPKKYDQIVGERGVKLSVGQKQRVALARVILRDPKIIILDEPTSALDAKAEKFIEKSLKEVMKSRTTFIIAHRLRTVRRADKILVLKDGKIAEEGRHEELIKIPNGVYRELYEFQKL